MYLLHMSCTVFVSNQNNCFNCFKWYYDQKNHFSFSFRFYIVKACLFDTSLAKSWASNFVQRLSFWVKVYDFTVRHYSRSNLTDWTSEGWIEDKMTSKTHQLKIAPCKHSSFFIQNTSLKVWKFKTPVLHFKACAPALHYDVILSSIQLS